MLLALLLAQLAPANPAGPIVTNPATMRRLAFFEAFPSNGAGTSGACSTTPPTAAKGEVLSFTRASVAECYSNDGQTLTQMAANQVRVSSGTAQSSVLGIWSENGATNSLVYARDQSQAAWTKTNMTCVRNQPGMRGGDANGATRCTATAANATVCQTIITGAATRTSSGNIKRAVGSGVVEVTRDGATYAAITSRLSSTLWRRVVPWDTPGCAGGNCILVSGMSSGIANPQVCVRLATSGDAVDLDFWQDEAGWRATSPIDTGAAAVPRADEVAYFTVPSMTVRSLRVEAQMNGYNGAFFAAAGAWKDNSNVLHIRNLAASADQNFACDNVQAGANNVAQGQAFTPLIAGGFTSMSCGVTDSTSIVWKSRGIPFTTATATTAPTGVTRIYVGGNALSAGFSLSAVVRNICADPVAGRCDSTSWATEGQPLIAIGDSITYGINQIPTRWVYALSQALVRPVYNLGLTGISSAVCLADYRAYGKAHGYVGATVLCGVNDINGGGTAASAFANLQTLYDEIRADGLHLTIGTILPFGNYVQWNASKQTELEALNTLIRNYCTANGVTCVDFYNSAIRSGVALAAPYDSGDGIHPNAAGGALMSTLWEAANP